MFNVPIEIHFVILLYPSQPLLSMPCIFVLPVFSAYFNGSYRILMFDRCLLQPPRVFLLAVSKDQAPSDWHQEKQMFIWSQNK